MSGEADVNAAIRSARGFTPGEADREADEPTSDGSIDAGAHGPEGGKVDMNEILRDGARRRLGDDD